VAAKKGPTAVTGAPQRERLRRSKRGYARALRDAGVVEKDLELLRELADMNARELSQADDTVPASRILL